METVTPRMGLESVNAKKVMIWQAVLEDAMIMSLEDNAATLGVEESVCSRNLWQ